MRLLDLVNVFELIPTMMKNFIYCFYYAIYRLNDGWRTPTIMAVLIVLNIYSILQFFTPNASLWALLSFLIGGLTLPCLIDREREIIKYCLVRPRDYAVIGWLYLITSVMIVVVVCWLI